MISVVKCLPRFLKGHFAQFATPIALADLANCDVLVLILTPVRKRGYVVRRHHRLHLCPTAARTLVPLVILVARVVVVHRAHLAVITKVVVRRAQSAGGYVYRSSAVVLPSAAQSEFFILQGVGKRAKKKR